MSKTPTPGRGIDFLEIIFSDFTLNKLNNPVLSAVATTKKNPQKLIMSPCSHHLKDFLKDYYQKNMWQPSKTHDKYLLKSQTIETTCEHSPTQRQLSNIL